MRLIHGSGRIAVIASSLAVITLLSLPGCGLPEGDYLGKLPDKGDITPQHLRWCNSGEPESLDPAMASTTTSMKLVYAMFDGLTNYDENAMPTPGMATHWEISPDLRTFTFHLRRGAQWTNGREITAYDYAYQIIRVLHPLTASPNAKVPGYLTNGDSMNANRVRVVLSDEGDFRAGDVVLLQKVKGSDKSWSDMRDRPDSNVRKSSKPLRFRDLGAPADAAYATLAADQPVTLIEITGRPGTLPTPPSDSKEPWAYIHSASLSKDGMYGWVPLSDLDISPHRDVQYIVTLAPNPDQLAAATKRIALETAADELARKMLQDLDKQTATGTEVPTGVAAVAPVAAAAPATPGPSKAEPKKEYTIKGSNLLMLPEVVGVRVPDPYTLVLSTPDPTPFMINFSVQRAFRATPREAVSRAPLRWFHPHYTKDVVSSGPMRATRWLERDYVELVRNEKYYNQDEIKLDKLTAYSIDDQASATMFYISGGCDATTSNLIPAAYIPIANGERRKGDDLGKPYLDYAARPYLGVYFVLVNTQVVSNRHLRRALALSVDRSLLPPITKGGEIPSAQLMPGTPISLLSPEDRALCKVDEKTPGVAGVVEPGTACYVPPPGLDFNLELAKKELALAKQEMGAAFPKTISYKYNSGVEQHKLIAEFLQNQWKLNLGINISLESQEWKVYVSDTRAGKYELGRFGNILNFPDPEAEILATYRCKSPDNRPKYCNPEYEKLMDEASTTFNRQERLEVAKRAEELLVGDAAMIPLYVYTQRHLQKPYVRDLFINVIDQPPIHRAYLDPNWRDNPQPIGAAGNTKGGAQ